MAQTLEQKRIESRAYYAANRDRVLAKHREWKTANREKLLEQGRAYAAAHRIENTARSIAWAKANPLRARVHRKKYNSDNKEKLSARMRLWRAKNPERSKAIAKRSRDKHYKKINAGKKDYAARNRDKINAYMRKYHAANPEKYPEYQGLRRAEKLQNGTANCTKKIALLKLVRFCHWCCDRLTNMNLTIDHVIPLKLGGAHIPDNLVACCRRCNSSNNDKLVHEWTWRTV